MAFQDKSPEPTIPHCEPRYEVQHWTLIDGWVNTWTIELGAGSSAPETFATAQEALDALAEHFEDLDMAVAAGDIDGACDRAQYRIRRVGES